MWTFSIQGMIPLDFNLPKQIIESVQSSMRKFVVYSWRRIQKVLKWWLCSICACTFICTLIYQSDSAATYYWFQYFFQRDVIHEKYRNSNYSRPLLVHAPPVSVLQWRCFDSKQFAHAKRFPASNFSRMLSLKVLVLRKLIIIYYSKPHVHVVFPESIRRSSGKEEALQFRTRQARNSSMAEAVSPNHSCKTSLFLRTPLF